MLRSVRSVTVVFSLVVLSYACSSGGSGPTPPPPPPPPPPTPANLLKLSGDNQTAEPGSAVATAPSVRVTSSAGTGISGVGVTFGVTGGGGSVTGGTPSTGSDGIATVGSWVLGPAEGANTLTASIATQGVAGNPASFTATGEFPIFNPTANATITGDRTFASVNIPAGVTVAVTADATITVLGDYTQAGVVVAPCHSLTIDAGGMVNVTGNIENDCVDPGEDGEDLIIIGRGGYTIEGNEVVSSGDIFILDGPDLNFTPPLSSYLIERPVRQANATSWRCRLINMTLRARPLNKNKGANGSPMGQKGRSGASRTSGCGQLLSGQTGGHLLVSGVTFVSGNGAEGGDGTSNSSVPAVGGAGGAPGAYNLVADEDIDLMGTVTFNLGNGGRGGNAIATAPAGSPGGNATATGGAGARLKPENFSSPVRIEARTGTLTVHGNLVFNFGMAGDGGNATANGGAGNPGNPGAKGGDATANGGPGGDSHPFSLNAGGSVVFLTGSHVDINGGAAGKGGASTKTPGKGGAGNVPGAAGGPGGNAFGVGGPGGKGQPSAFAGLVVPGGRLAHVELQSPGGDAGASTYTGGGGGDGALKCPAPGGAGGKGGDASGGGGELGPGTPDGMLSMLTFSGFGNGGNGAQGDGPGGAGGANNTSFGSGATGTPMPGPGNFQPGSPGPPCPMEGSSIAFETLVPPTQQVVQGGTGSISVGFIRNNYSSTIGVLVKDQGGTARGSTTIPGANTTGSVIFQVPIDEPLGTRIWSAMGSGTGVADVSMNFGLSVNPAPIPATVNGDLNTVPHTGNMVPFGPFTMDLTFNGNVRGSIQYETVSAPGNHFWADNAPAGLRVGSGNGHGFRALFNTAMVDGLPYNIVGYGYCLKNATGIGEMTPVRINQRNAMDEVVFQETVTSLPNGNAGPLCRWTTRAVNAVSAEILAPVGVGFFVDFGSVQVWNAAP